MDINKLNKTLQESLNGFAFEAHSHVASKKQGESLDEYDYDELARQTFYVMNDFRKNIIKHLKDTK